jgi:uncharacterized protein (UPF0333 family)
MKKKNRQQGQASLEYILILVVVLTIGMVVFKKFKEYFIEGDRAFITRFFDSMGANFSSGNKENKFKRFKIAK